MKIVTYDETIAKSYLISCQCIKFTRIKGKYTLFLK